LGVFDKNLLIFLRYSEENGKIKKKVVKKAKLEEVNYDAKGRILLSF